MIVAVCVCGGGGVQRPKDTGQIFIKDENGQYAEHRVPAVCQVWGRLSGLQRAVAGQVSGGREKGQEGATGKDTRHSRGWT